MKVWSEKQYRIQNMSTNLRISEKQLSKYYDMLPPICKKLGIDVPELYLELNVVPNAFTAGDENPFIVMTTGLIETMPEELIPTVLAHECGHIACHHCLYTVMGKMILNESVRFWDLGELAIFPIQVAFAYWMRCSELSADRAAAICDGTADKVVEMCMRFAGYDKDIMGEASVEEFLNQAKDYMEMVEDSTWNKTLEFILMNQKEHPLNAVRAHKCAQWGKTDRFTKLVDYVEKNENCTSGNIVEQLKELPMTEDSAYYIGKNVWHVNKLISEIGFKNVSMESTHYDGILPNSGMVYEVSVNGVTEFNAGDWFPIDAEIKIKYYCKMGATKFTDEPTVTDTAKEYIAKFIDQFK